MLHFCRKVLFFSKLFKLEIIHVSILFRIDHVVVHITQDYELILWTEHLLSGSQKGLPGGSLKNTGHWQWQCRWHKILSCLHIHVHCAIAY